VAASEDLIREAELLKARSEDLIREAELAGALEDANAAYNAAPSDEGYAAHNRAQEALFAHRAARAPETVTVTAGASPQEG
jgi:hypothetical protein